MKVYFFLVLCALTFFRGVCSAELPYKDLNWDDVVSLIKREIAEEPSRHKANLKAGITSNVQGSATLHRIFSGCKFEAEKGDAHAQHILGAFYFYGFDGTLFREDVKKAFLWQESSAKQGYFEAMYLLGCWYATKKYQNASEFFYWTERLSKLDCKYKHWAEYQLSLCYFTGFGVAPDKEKSFFYCEKSAIGEYSDATLDLALKYEKGEGTLKNLKKALFWFKVAAEHNVVGARERVDEYENLKKEILSLWRESLNSKRKKSEAYQKMVEGRRLLVAKSSHNGFEYRSGYGLAARTDNSAANSKGSSLIAEGERMMAEIEALNNRLSSATIAAMDLYESIQVKSKKSDKKMTCIVLYYDNEILIAINCRTSKIVKFDASKYLEEDSLKKLAEFVSPRRMM